MDGHTDIVVAAAVISYIARTVNAAVGALWCTVVSLDIQPHKSIMLGFLCILAGSSVVSRVWWEGGDSREVPPATAQQSGIAGLAASAVDEYVCFSPSSFRLRNNLLRVEWDVTLLIQRVIAMQYACKPHKHHQLIEFYPFGFYFILFYFSSRYVIRWSVLFCKWNSLWTMN